MWTPLFVPPPLVQGVRTSLFSPHPGGGGRYQTLAFQFLAKKPGSVKPGLIFWPSPLPIAHYKFFFQTRLILPCSFLGLKLFQFGLFSKTPFPLANNGNQFDWEKFPLDPLCPRDNPRSHCNFFPAPSRPLEGGGVGHRPICPFVLTRGILGQSFNGDRPCGEACQRLKG
jgi:hypothetical protein